MRKMSHWRPPLPVEMSQLTNQGDMEMTQAGRAGRSLQAELHGSQLRSHGTKSPSSSIATNKSTSLHNLQHCPKLQASLSAIELSPPPAPCATNSFVTEPSTPASSVRNVEVQDQLLSTTESASSSKLSKNQSTSSVPTSSTTTIEAVSRLAEKALQSKSESLSHLDQAVRLPSIPKDIRDLGSDYSRYPSMTSLPGLRFISQPVTRSTSQVRLESTAIQTPLLRATTANPYTDSQADLRRWGYPDDSIGATNPFFGGEKGSILYHDEIEDDDEFHMPTEHDDKRYRPTLRQYLEPRHLCSAIGAVVLILGLACIFIIIPILTFRTKLFLPVDDNHGQGLNGPAWAYVNNRTYPLLKNVRRGLVDPDTPTIAKTRKSTFDSSTLKLVFSDEFNDNNRTFYPGDDPYWTAPDFWYGATKDIAWYDPDAVTTSGGTLQLKLDRFPNHGLQFRSGMLNSWNQLCFKGGVFEVSVSLAGPAGTPGLWPGAWSMGNLGRPGYLATTDGVWPYTYNSCDVGITPNQSSGDGISYLPGQRLSSCTCKGAEHPTPGTGRGAPEIDILEASVDSTNRLGVVTQSFQVAPFDVWYRPNHEFMAIPNRNTTNMNTYAGGPFQQAVSATSMLNNAWYDGHQYQKYAFEYVPGTSKGKIAWFVGEDPTFIMDGRAIGRNGNVNARQVSQEPMSMILNLGISENWSWLDWANLKFPTVMHVDYVRIYQKEGQESVTCDPAGYETTGYIRDHPVAYRNPNFTLWEQTGYSWPKNKFTGC